MLLCVLAVLKVHHAFLEMPAVVGKARYLLEAVGAAWNIHEGPIANSSLPSIGTLPVHGRKEQYIVKFDTDFGTISAISFTSRSKSKR